MNNQDNNDDSNNPSWNFIDTNYLAKQGEEKKFIKKENDRLYLQNKRALQTDVQKQTELDVNAVRNVETILNESDPVKYKRRALDQSRIGERRTLQSDEQKQTELDANAERNAETRFNLLSCNTAVYLLGSSEQAKAICYYKFDYLNS
jgi:hypothetical protein